MNYKGYFKICLSFFFFTIQYIFGQEPIEKGFNYLEVGKFAEAEIFFQDFLTHEPENKTAQLCYGRAVGLNGNPKKAMEIFKDLLESDAKNIEYLLNHAECLLWLKQFDDALAAYSKIEQDHPENAIVHLGLGNTYSNLKSFKKSIFHYNKALSINPKILGIYIGLANTHFAYNEDRKALNTIDRAFEIDSTHNGLKTLQQRILNRYIPSVTHKSSVTNDSGKNRSYIADNSVVLPISTRLQFQGNHNYKSSRNRIKGLTSNSHSFQVGLSYKHTNKINSKSNLGVIRASGYSNRYVNWIGDTNIEIKPNTNHQINFGYKKEYHNFNADLMDLEIAMHHLYANYHHLTKLKIGFFTQYFYTLQSDKNKRSLWFTSLYYLWKAQPTIKTGVNYLNISFKDQVPENYFSPELFNSVEIFAGFTYNLLNKKFFCDALGAYGYQFVKGDMRQETYRGNINLGYKLSPYFKASLFAQYSNLAAGNAAGFSFNEFGIKLSYKFKHFTLIK